MKYTHAKGRHYLSRSLPFNKCFEAGVQYTGHAQHLSCRFSFSFRGEDHAGLKFYFEFWRLFFELNIVDCRHWNYDADRWHALGEEKVEDCDEGYDS